MTVGHDAYDQHNRMRADRRGGTLRALPADPAEGWPVDVPAPQRTIRLTPASAVKVRPVRWLWDTTPEGAPPTSHGRIAMGSLTIAAGTPGLGKSQFAAWMAARITRGELPGELYGEPRSVIYAATEDSWEYTIAPRLRAAGADLERVFCVEVQDDGEQYARLTLPVDTAALGQVAEEYGVALLIADPLLSLIDKGINDYRAAEVRHALEPLVKAAEQHGFTVLGLAHFTKSGGADPLARLAGSGAFGQVIRSMIAFARQDGAEGEDPQFVMSLEKNNLGRNDLPSHAYTIEPVTIATDEGCPSYVSRFVLGEETTESVRQVMRDEANPSEDPAERSEAVRWLRAYLTDRGGSADSKETKRAALDAGITESTLVRARRKLRVSIEMGGFGEAKKSFWTLPEAVVSSRAREQKPRGTHV